MVNKYRHKYNDIEIVIDYNLYADLILFYDDMVNSQMDMVLVIDGHEGTGKSFTARKLGALLSSWSKLPFGVDNIHFDIDPYIESSESGRKYQVNILDESRKVVNIKRSMSKSNVKFTNFLSENRDKNQAHILVLPAVHDLDPYISYWRMSMNIHHIKWHINSPKSLSGKTLDRGNYCVYDKTQLRKYMMNKDKYGKYTYPEKPMYNGKFDGQDVFYDYEVNQYEKKKQLERARKYDETMAAHDHIEQRNLLIRTLIKDGKNYDEVAKLCKLSESTIRAAVRGKK